jgi:hypothetical protein
MNKKRQLLDGALRDLGEWPATDADVQRILVDEELGPMNGATDFAYAAGFIADIRAGARRARRPRATEPKERPVDEATDGAAWDACRRRVLTRAAGVSPRFARGLFGLAGPASPDDLAGVLARAREVERQAGDELRLEVPVIEGEQVVVADVWTVYRGYATDPKEPAESAPPQALFYLAEHAARIARRTGVSQADVVLYLLCDLVVYWSPVRAFVEWDPFAIVVRADWPFVRPDDVAALFARARGSLYGLPADADAATRLDVGKRVMSAELVHFVAERRELADEKRRQGWGRLHKAWTAAYPEKPYKSLHSMKRAYQEAEKRLPEMTLSPAPWRPVASGKEDS